MRLVRQLLIFSIFCVLSSQIFTQNSYDEVKQVSERICNLVPYIKERTVAIKIAVGNHAGFGSGAIISPDGLILTCAHVAEISNVLTVITCDGKQHLATKLGMNSLNDYALLRIDGQSLPFFELGNSGNLKILQWIIAAGHPGGPYPDSQASIAVGRIRGLHKKLPVQLGIKFYDDAIQTDVPIFSGNSGGPLLDMEGKIIGINGAITLVNDLAFAVSIDEIKKEIPVLTKGQNIPGRGMKNIFDIFQELQEDIPMEDMYQMFKDTPLGKIIKLLGGDITPPAPQRPQLGIQLKQNNDDLQVLEVLPNSIAQMSGFQKDDKIISLKGEKIRNFSHFKKMLNRFNKGDQAIFEVERNGKVEKILVAFDRQGYSREQVLKRTFVYNGLELMDVTVKILVDEKCVGYGVIISPTGWVITNYQMLKNTPNISIQLQNPSASTYLAEVVGKDGKWDVVLLKFQSENILKAISIGDDKQLKVGQWVVSGGSDSGAIQVGMVSALERYVPSHRKIPTLGLFGLLGHPNKSAVRAYPEVIQHDSKIESDEFGTPLVNEKGELVGINCGHFYRGTTFAIPISAIKQILPQLQAGQQSEPPEEFRIYEAKVDPFFRLFEYFLDEKNQSKPLGKILEDITEQLSEPDEKKNGGFLGVEVTQHWQGVEVIQVMEGYAAQRSGIEKGDIIVEMGKQKIHSVVFLLEILENTPPGTKILLKVVRQAADQVELKEFEVTLDQRP